MEQQKTTGSYELLNRYLRQTQSTYSPFKSTCFRSNESHIAHPQETPCRQAGSQRHQHVFDPRLRQKQTFYFLDVQKSTENTLQETPRSGKSPSHLAGGCHLHLRRAGRRRKSKRRFLPFLGKQDRRGISTPVNPRKLTSPADRTRRVRLSSAQWRPILTTTMPAGVIFLLEAC
jgi:hypothetical protein